MNFRRWNEETNSIRWQSPVWMVINGFDAATNFQSTIQITIFHIFILFSLLFFLLKCWQLLYFDFLLDRLSFASSFKQCSPMERAFILIKLYKQFFFQHRVSRHFLQQRIKLHEGKYMKVAQLGRANTNTQKNHRQWQHNIWLRNVR